MNKIVPYKKLKTTTGIGIIPQIREIQMLILLLSRAKLIAFVNSFAKPIWILYERGTQQN